MCPTSSIYNNAQAISTHYASAHCHHVVLLLYRPYPHITPVHTVTMWYYYYTGHIHTLRQCTLSPCGIIIIQAISTHYASAHCHHVVLLLYRPYPHITPVHTVIMWWYYYTGHIHTLRQCTLSSCGIIIIQAISTHYASAHCHHVDIEGTSQESLSKEVIEIAKRKLGPDATVNFKAS